MFTAFVVILECVSVVRMKFLGRVLQTLAGSVLCANGGSCLDSVSMYVVKWCSDGLATEPLPTMCIEY